ncbi:MAG: hypothetical protein JJT78_00075, partial [Leptospira sp.]|nr:hypothetical protein [Leptospira sp.]
FSFDIYSYVTTISFHQNPPESGVDKGRKSPAIFLPFTSACPSPLSEGNGDVAIPSYSFFRSRITRMPDLSPPG